MYEHVELTLKNHSEKKKTPKNGALVFRILLAKVKNLIT